MTGDDERLLEMAREGGGWLWLSVVEWEIVGDGRRW